MNSKEAAVIETKGELALVLTRADKSPCDACASPCAQRACEKTVNIKLWAKNEDRADVGEKVLIEERGGVGSFTYGLLCLALPVASAAVCYIAAGKAGLSEAPSVGIAFAGLAAAAFIGVLVSRTLAKRFPSFAVKRIENSTEGSND